MYEFPNFPLAHRHFHYPQKTGNSSSYITHAHSNLYSYFLFTASLWNSLPSSVVSATTLPSFTAVVHVVVILFFLHWVHVHNSVVSLIHAFPAIMAKIIIRKEDNTHDH